MVDGRDGEVLGDGADGGGDGDGHNSHVRSGWAVGDGGSARGDGVSLGVVDGLGGHGSWGGGS